MSVFATIGVCLVKSANKDPARAGVGKHAAKQNADQVSELTTNRLSSTCAVSARSKTPASKPSRRRRWPSSST